MPTPHWTAYLSALLTPTGAVFAIIIAYRQWRIAQNKLKLDLFEKRLAVYSCVSEFIANRASRSTDATEDIKFLRGIESAQWLYDKSIVEYISGLWHKSADLACLVSELDGMPPSDERNEKVRAKHSLLKWFNDQHEVISKKFAPFLRINH